MAPRLRTLIFATLAALLTIVPASAAEARITFTMPQVGNLSGEGTGANRFTAHDIGIDCKGLTLFGEAEGNSTDLEVLPEYNECTAEALSGFIADFFQERCDFLLHDLKRAGEKERWLADLEIKCHGEYDAIGWDFFETEAKYHESHQVCSMRMPEGQTGTAELRNLSGARGGIEIHWSLPRLEYQVLTWEGSETSLLCGSTFAGMRADASAEGTGRLYAEAPEELSLSG